MTRHTELDDYKALLSLWKGWTLSFGAITASVVASLWLNRILLPALTLALGMGLYALVRRNRDASLPVCYVIPYLAIYTMLAAGTVMAAIDFWQSPRFFPGSPELHTPGNSAIPYIGALVVYPIAFAMMLYGSLRRYKLNICIDCRNRYGSPAERGFIGRLFCQEGLFQRSLMALLTGIMTTACWIYYFLRYVNVSFSAADTYAFIIVPAAVYLFSVIGMGIRYFSIWYYYDRDLEGTAMRHGRSSTLRYIIICGNEIFLHVPDSDSEIVIGDEKIDTPAKLTLPYSTHINLADARYYFLNFFGINANRGVEVRTMYATRNATDSCNIFHYFAFVADRSAIDSSKVNGKWFTIMAIKNLLDEHSCAQLLGAEIVRLHTIAMAWKTYDRNGRRLYKIKHYVPTFRVCDIHKWDVDYNDPHWLYVARNNEDKPLYHVKQFWRRYVSGIKD